MSEKDLVFIVSAGRTGTAFLGERLGISISHSYSCHEPDRYAGFSRRTLRAIGQFGFNTVITRRLLGHSGIRHLTRRRLRDQINDEVAAEQIHQQRDSFHQSIKQPLIIEAYYQWYGVLPALRLAYPNCKIVGILRDPRNWVLSLSHRQLRHRMGRFVSGVTPMDMDDRTFISRWRDMDKFARSCWEWKMINDRIVHHCETDPGARLHSFEALFPGGADELSPDMKSMLAFLTDFDERQYHADTRKLNIEKPANESSVRPSWQQLTGEQARLVEDICGASMAAWGYGGEPEWQAMLATQ